jgi:DNA-binding MarR family transcriptional regulator
MAEPDIILRKFGDSLTVDSWNVNKTDVNCRHGRQATQKAGGAQKAAGGENLLFLTDEQLRKGIEAMFFAYRGFTADPDRILAAKDYGRAHHRALHFINRMPGTTVNNLLAILGVTKQSLNRVLRTLIEDGLVESRVGRSDRRERTST